MGLATIFGLLAFFIALIALWLTSDIVKKVESQNEKFVRAHIASVREDLRDMEKLLKKTSRATQSHDEGQSSLDGRLNDHAKALNTLRGRLEHVSEQLEDLDRSIPSRYRVRVVKDVPKEIPKAGNKASIQ